MAKNESRRERKKTQKNVPKDEKNKLNKVYYWIIGILFLILFLLVIYIFAKSGDNVDLSDEEDTTSIVQEEELDVKEKPSADLTKDENAEEETEQEDTDDTEQEQEAEPEENKKENEQEDEEDTEDVEEEATEDEDNMNEDAPLDTNHDVNYNNGSADRIAIKKKVMQATGLGNDLIESWVGNNGPGRVTADVYSSDKSDIYRVYLQYGDGEWHVTSYDNLSSIPSN